MRRVLRAPMLNYLNCLQNYYLNPAVKAAAGSSCGTSVNASDAACVKGQLQTFNYPGQNQTWTAIRHVLRRSAPMRPWL